MVDWYLTQNQIRLLIQFGLRRLTRAHAVLPGGNALILRQSP